MEDFLQSIEAAIEQSNWNAAISLSLMLPDICPSMQGIRRGRKRYMDWFNTYAADDFSSSFGGAFLSCEDCYALRCSILHSGTDDISDNSVEATLSKVTFTTLQMHNIRFNDQLILDPRKFSMSMVNGARKWLSDVAQDSAVQKRLRMMVSVKNDAFSPIPGVRLG
ncbi:MAG: hypothetical protein E2597_01335 [Stenotrophomonas sp.]|nr:hypothetical protein [Stenotrophomonas sp.]